MSGPHEPTKSMYERPSASQRREPSPRWMKGGAPPTARKARTGLLTPPGMTRLAASRRRLDSVMREAPRRRSRADAQQVLGVDVVRGARVPRIALGVAGVQLVLGVAAAEQPPFVAAAHDDTT